jgi:hypothetical protein
LPELAYTKYDDDVDNKNNNPSRLGWPVSTTISILIQSELALNKFSKNMWLPINSAFNKWKKVCMATNLEKAWQCIIQGQHCVKQM